MDSKTFGFYFLLFVIVLVGAKFYLIAASFFPAISAAFILAYLTNPIYRYFLSIGKRKTIAAFAVLFLVFALVLIPSVLVVAAAQNQVSALFTPDTLVTVQKALLNLQRFLSERLGFTLAGQVDMNLLYERLGTAAQNAVTEFAPRLLVSITGILLSAFLIFFLLYYLLTNAERVIATFRRYFPLSDTNITVLLERAGSDTRALILGQFLVALIQGTLGGVGFLIFGVPGVFLWGFVMTMLSFIPFLGSFLVWIPAGIILIAQGEYFNGFGLFAWGAFLVGTIDNIVRPKLTSTLGTIHPVTVLLGVFIGLNEWGVMGLVLGPLIITLLLALIRMFREEYITEKTR